MVYNDCREQNVLLLGEVITIINALFRNSIYKDLTLDQVYEILLNFMGKDPHNEYKYQLERIHRRALVKQYLSQPFTYTR